MRPSLLFSKIRSALQSALLAALLATLLPHPAARAEIIPLSKLQCEKMRIAHVLSKDNPVPCSRLATVRFDYMDFNGAARSGGSLVVLDAVAPQVEALFGELLLRSTPIQQALPLEDFNGDDEKSMAANNTSAFNGRPMTGGGSWSKHAYGVAIDINPLQNPYVSKSKSGVTQVLPAASSPRYLQRAASASQPGMAEDVVGVFYEHGFLIWGGNWKQPIDYQHFEIGSRDFIRTLVKLPPQQATREFERYVAGYRNCMQQAQHASTATDNDEEKDDAPENAALRESCAARSRK
jgi:hypothetical protein